MYYTSMNTRVRVLVSSIPYVVFDFLFLRPLTLCSCEPAAAEPNTFFALLLLLLLAPPSALLCLLLPLLLVCHLLQ